MHQASLTASLEVKHENDCPTKEKASKKQGVEICA
jgi:hypothetical protein